jgi:hypothetical protein
MEGRNTPRRPAPREACETKSIKSLAQTQRELLPAQHDYGKDEGDRERVFGKRNGPRPEISGRFVEKGSRLSDVRKSENLLRPGRDNAPGLLVAAQHDHDSNKVKKRGRMTRLLPCWPPGDASIT